MRLERLRLEFRMELATNEVWMVRQLNDFYVRAIRSGAGDLQAGGGQGLFVFPVELISVAMPFADFRLAVNFVGQSARFNLASPGAKPHGAAQFFHAA